MGVLRLSINNLEPAVGWLNFDLLYYLLCTELGDIVGKWSRKEDLAEFVAFECSILDNSSTLEFR